MAEVTIKAHSRRGKNGKTVQVKSYTRRVGKKGVHSPKKTSSEEPGEELEQKVAEKISEVPELSAEEIERRKEIMRGFKRMEEEKRNFGMPIEQYHRYKLEKSEKDNKRVASSSHVETIKNPLSPEGSKDILQRVEDKIAKFVEKYSNKKYKRAL